MGNLAQIHGLLGHGGIRRRRSYPIRNNKVHGLFFNCAGFSKILRRRKEREKNSIGGGHESYALGPLPGLAGRGAGYAQWPMPFVLLRAAGRRLSRHPTASVAGPCPSDKLYISGSACPWPYCPRRLDFPFYQLPFPRWSNLHFDPLVITVYCKGGCEPEWEEGTASSSQLSNRQ